MKRLSILLLAAVLLEISSAFSQSEMDPLWFTTRGGVNVDESWAVDVDSQGNIYWATHQTDPGPLADVVLYKLAPDGSEIWSRRWGDFWNEQAYAVAVQEPYVLVGGTKWTGIWVSSCDMALVCWSTDGDSLWDLTWDGGYGYEELDGLVVAGDTIYVAGWTTTESTSNDLAVLKLNLDGQLIDSQTWGTPNWDEANGQMVVGDQYVYVAGRYDAPTELVGGDAVLVAFDKHTLDYAWHRTWGGDDFDDAFGMIEDGTHLYVVGLTLSFGGSHIFLLKYDRYGNLIWNTIWGGSGAESARSLDITADGDILVTGKTTAYGQGEHDIVLLKYAPDDSLMWFQTWGGPEIETAHGIAIDGADVYIAGETYSYGEGKNDALLIKATVDGQFPETNVDEQDNSSCRPTSFFLEQNYPNPFNATSTIRYSLAQKDRVRLKIYDILGRKVNSLVDGIVPAGHHAVTFVARELPSGIYFCRLQVGGFAQTRKMVLIR